MNVLCQCKTDPLLMIINFGTKLFKLKRWIVKPNVLKNDIQMLK